MALAIYLCMNIQTLKQILDSNGGITLNADGTVFSPEQGFSVAYSKGWEKQFDNVSDALLAYIEHYKTNASVFNKVGTNIKVGLWVDNGVIYLDLSEYVPELGKAKFLAKKRKQLAIFDFQTKQSIYL